MARMNLSKFLREQWTTIPQVNSTSDGAEAAGKKTMIVTGATNGLGLEAAKQLHTLSSSIVDKLILTSRDMAKVEEVEKFVTQGFAPSRCQWAKLDLSSFSSVSAFVDALGGAKVNYVLANAALATHKYTQTPDGWESALQVNYLSNALLAILLLPNLMSASARDASLSRLVLVSSDVHYSLPSLSDFRNVPNILEAVNRKEYCTSGIMKRRTMLSKFFVIAFARELASRLTLPVTSDSPKGIIISSVNPGFCRSKLTRETESHFPGSLWLPLLKRAVARPTEVGATVLVRATLMDTTGMVTGGGGGTQLHDDGRAAWHGRYLSSCLEAAEESDLLLGEDGKEFSRKLWADTVYVLDKIDPRVTEILERYNLNSAGR
ncbi:NAD(P)-binding protein [Gymnopus androsaceus JB14]|uniref:NAD(P)-binding protein n=1 Tax=Gymnopus androsaceus JB14 TaxID=1447944 RepID=A0A6A4I652_9AGAR|nr:NAD(P)-binding protein [Gymnopus androsaceus JB14]